MNQLQSQSFDLLLSLLGDVRGALTYLLALNLGNSLGAPTAWTTSSLSSHLCLTLSKYQSNSQLAICWEARPGVPVIPYSSFVHWGLTGFVWCCTKDLICHHNLGGCAANKRLVNPPYSELCLLTCHAMSPRLPLESPFHAESEAFQRASEEISAPCQPGSGIQMPFLA